MNAPEETLDQFGPRPIFVRCPVEGVFIASTAVVIDDVFEDFDEADMVGFVCPFCNVHHYSNAFGG